MGPQQAYRGRGLAKALASKLFKTGTREFGDDGWFDCVVGKTADEFSSKTPETSPATPAAEAPATETPAPETPQ